MLEIDNEPFNFSAMRTQPPPLLEGVGSGITHLRLLRCQVVRTRVALDRDIAAKRIPVSG
eukprot:1364554-Prymnesium_polylepis.1